MYIKSHNDHLHWFCIQSMVRNWFAYRLGMHGTNKIFTKKIHDNFVFEGNNVKNYEILLKSNSLHMNFFS